ncbi:unnamed protein product [Brassica oleracea var. botrytis]|uniref:(rape) hypothetical protein n=1 Tax=Brassica napus TaxID=3708 RepID=A0A078FIP1_BRANA|nr:unnamed protein product [Brassica napus]CDY12859.1 BnaC07g15740D [Brassica napus]
MILSYLCNFLWEKSSWGRKLIVQKRRAALNEIDRFKIMLAKIQELAKLKKEITALMFF